MSSLLYEALMLGRNKKIENEEFLVATGKKGIASFSTIEECVIISDVVSDGEYCIHLHQDVQGYMEIEPYCGDNFITFDKRIITSEEFTDREFEFRFTVLSGKLHNGRNYTNIVFKSSGQRVEVPVVIDNKIVIRLSDVNPKEKLFQIQRTYLNLQMGKIEQGQWEQESLELLSDIPGDGGNSLCLMLFRAQVHITRKEYEFAKNYIEYVATQIPKLENKNYVLRCYFIYLASLYDEMPGVINCVTYKEHWTDDQRINEDSKAKPELSTARGNNIADMGALQKVYSFLQKAPDWKIMWILANMDPIYRNNYQKRLDDMQNMFYQGRLSSPIMYIETLKIYKKRPELMKQVGVFEIQILNFAAKNDFLSQEIAERAAELIFNNDYDLSNDAAKKIAVNMLQFCYEKYLGSSILGALCMMLIQADCRAPIYHKYFVRAVKAGLQSESIFNYYIYTLDQGQMEPILEAVLTYFLEHTELLYEYKAYMYANIITNKAINPECYRNSTEAIIKFAEYQVSLGQNNECLAIIYKDILENNRITKDMIANFFDVICIKEVLCDNERMRSVLVFHKELQVYQESMIKNGKAYVKIYSPEALLLFKDFDDNVYYHVKYKVNQLIESRRYIDLCIKDVPINKYMMIGDTLPLLRAYKPPVEILEFFTSHQHKGAFRKSYEQELINGMVLYYSKNSQDDKVYDELLKFGEFELTAKTRGELIMIMLKRGRIDNAYYEVKKYGINCLSPQSLAVLGHAYINTRGDKEDPVLTAICEAGYGANGFDDLVFGYMYKYYNGRLDILIDMFRACNAYNKPAHAVEERVLNKSIQTGEHPDIVAYIYKQFREENGDEKLSARYIHFRALMYLEEIMQGGMERETSSDMSFIDFMENDMMNGYNFDDESVIAYLLYRQKLESPNANQLKIIENNLKNLVSKGKMLEEFKYYGKYFALPSTMLNTIIISAFSQNTEAVPHITYELTSAGKSICGTEEMEEIFRFCYVKYFTLFYGDRVVFSMDGRDNMEVRYEDLKIVYDGSKYSEIDNMLRCVNQHNSDEFKRCAADYYVKERLIDALF